MTPKDLAEFYALLTILEPESMVCKLAARLATAGTASDNETDTAVIKEIRQHATQIAAELKSVGSSQLERKSTLVAKFVEAANSSS